LLDFNFLSLTKSSYARRFGCTTFFERGFDSRHLHHFIKVPIVKIKKTFVNNQIRATEVRVINNDGAQIGVFSLDEAIKIAKEQGLDLIQITEKATPPVCKITDYGKYLYWEKKKEREKRLKTFHSEVKGIRLKFGMSPHDMEIRTNTAIKFLEKGHRVRVELLLKGRQKADTLSGFAKEKIGLFLKMTKDKMPIKIEREIKREGRGLTIIIVKAEEKS